jgi:hypothetical protein
MLQKNQQIIVIKSKQVNDQVQDSNYRLRRSLRTKRGTIRNSQEIRFSLVVIFHLDKNHHERNVVVYVSVFGCQ